MMSIGKMLSMNKTFIVMNLSESLMDVSWLQKYIF